MAIDEFLLRRFDEPDEVREFPLGRFELIRIGGMTLAERPTSPAGAGASTSASTPTTAARSSIWAS